jgi:hypothetical protein
MFSWNRDHIHHTSFFATYGWAHYNFVLHHIRLEMLARDKLYLIRKLQKMKCPKVSKLVSAILTDLGV